MEEPELRIGGWEKKSRGRWFKRLLSLIIVVFLGLLVIGPSLIEYKTAEIGQSSFYLTTGIWNGPFEQIYTKEFNGHFKISSLAYETTDGSSGRLIIMSISSLLNLDSQIESLVVDKIKEKTDEEGLTLVGNGVVLNENNNGLPPNAVLYKWEAKVTEAAGFFAPLGVGETLQVKTIFWTKANGGIQDGFQAIICIAFGVNQTTINQATELVENVS
jgi:hypothetical protein